jgi:hypothetical protein
MSMTPGRAYDIMADGHTLAVRAFSAPIAADLARSALVAKQQQDPDIVQTFRALSALDLDAGTVALVTRIVGYDAAAYAISTRAGNGWNPVFSGGGAAN